MKILFTDNSKPLETMGRKAIGPFNRMAAVLPKGEFFMKKIISLATAFLITLSASTMTYATTQDISSDLSSGVVSIKVSSVSESKLLFLVEKDGIRYTYPIVDTDVNSFPLQLGNGTYTVRLMQNIEGNSYKELTKSTVSLNLEDSDVVFLNSIQDIEWNENQAVALKAKALTVGLASDEQKIKAIYSYITKNYKYDYSKAKNVTSGYFPNVESLFLSETGICYDYAAVFAAMMRSVDIPTKLVKGYAVPTKDVYHAWNEVLVDGVWKIIDTTIDASYVQAGKTVSMFKATNDYSAKKIY